MITPHRRAHRRIFAFLAIVLPLLLWLALSAVPPAGPSTDDGLPAALVSGDGRAP